MLSRFEEENGGQLVIATVCLLETSRHGLLETELLELLADENNLTPPEYKPGEDEPTETKSSTNSEDKSSEATDALADKLQEQVNITDVHKEENKNKEEDEKEQDNKSGWYSEGWNGGGDKRVRGGGVREWEGQMLKYWAFSTGVSGFFPYAVGYFIW